MKAPLEELEKIASETCFVPMLTQRGRDSLDFHDVNCAGLRAGLEQAVDLGAQQLANIITGMMTAEEIVPLIRRMARAASSGAPGYPAQETLDAIAHLQSGFVYWHNTQL